jgi:hypothetical protein
MATSIHMPHCRATAVVLLAALGVFWTAAGNVAPAADPVRTAVQTGTPRRVIAADSSRRTLAAIAADGSVEWKRPNGAIHDLHLLPNGSLLLQDGWTRILEVDADGKPVWEYDAQGGDNAGGGGAICLGHAVFLSITRLGLSRTRPPDQPDGPPGLPRSGR